MLGFDHFDKNVPYRITIPDYQTAPSTDDPHKIFAVEQHNYAQCLQDNGQTNKAIL